MDTETRGVLAPATAAETRSAYDEVAPAAETVVRETARLWFDAESFRSRVTDDAVATAHDALFASLLEVRVGTREAFAAWREGFDGDVEVSGSPDVDHVAWHVAGDDAVATTFHDDAEAAVATCRRQAFGRCHRDRLADRPDR